ncbi:hypothetical protein B0T25DRAFT_208728 [Lasiosphaeria hispida]|uniref:Uncharacterized protein n=1 Tax=Lasiosphaeria hispida TaxID=260671 RepID=A0AAJ0HIW9_9PEZI|nr:hypothetical protein B0T25DRAFT_208728 [Lasiosphaeria hispida]
MFKTKSLSSLKSIFPPIHQPLPLKERDTRRLLNALTSSFRTRLDEEHGFAPVPAVKYLPSTTAPAATVLKDAPSQPTDRHLRAILSNPLFGHNDIPAGVASPQDPTWGGHKEIFARAVAKGMMDIKRAHGFLLRVSQNIRQSPTVSLRKGMQESGAGLLVLQWLRASGQERSLSFLHNRGFTQVLMRFMVAEGLDELAWTWLQRLMPKDGTSDGSNKVSASFLLDTLVVAKSGALELDDAYASILRAESLFKERSATPLNLLQAWRNLAWESTVDSWRHKVPGVDLFESFVVMPEHIGKPMALEHAHLNLYHPTEPSPEQAIAYITNDNEWRTTLPKVISESSNPKKSLAKYGKKLSSLGIDTVQHLTKVGESREAQLILELTRDNLAILGYNFTIGPGQEAIAS